MQTDLRIVQAPSFSAHSLTKAAIAKGIHTGNYPMPGSWFNGDPKTKASVSMLMNGRQFYSGTIRIDPFLLRRFYVATAFSVAFSLRQVVPTDFAGRDRAPEPTGLAGTRKTRAPSPADNTSASQWRSVRQPLSSVVMWLRPTPETGADKESLARFPLRFHVTFSLTKTSTVQRPETPTPAL